MTSVQVRNVRITYKRKRPNPLFQEWLEDLHENAKANNSKIEPMLREALESLSKYPLPLKTGAECAILKGFNSKLCRYLDIHLQDYYSYERKKEEEEAAYSARKRTRTFTRKSYPDCDDDVKIVNIRSKSPQRSISDSDQLENNNSQSSSNYQTESKASNTVTNCLTKKVTKSKERIYKPAFRTGAYAILVGLLEHMQDCPADPTLTKENLIEIAQKHSDESFLRPKPESFYTAWSNISRLITKGLVEKTKKKKLFYSLTLEGVTLAIELLKESARKLTINDIIFNTSASTITNTTSSQDYNVAKTGETDTESLSSQLIGSQSSNESVIAVEMPAGSFEVILLIDKNETGGVTKKNDPTVAQFNKYPDLKHEYRSLKVGDFTWIAQHKVHKEQELVLPYVVERKRMDDLGSSIKDGRFHEQKFRLRKCGLKNVFYLVENYGSNKHVGLPLQSLMQALANTRVQDGFKVHMTDSLNNSARFLAILTKRLTIEFKDKNLKGYNKEPMEDDLMTFQYFNKSSAKTKPLTVTETFIKLLLQLKGVSVEKALTITNTYSTPALLIKAYDDCNQKEGEMLLANLKYGNTTRNVGPKTSKSVYQLFTYRHLS